MKKTFALVALVGLACGSIVAEDSTKVTPPADTTKMDTMKETTPMEKGKAADTAQKLEYKTTKLGVKYADLVVGAGKEAALGSKVECHYTLWFANEKGEKGVRFQSTKDGGQSFTCTLGQRLIQGWSDGMVGMKEGGTRLMVIPSQLGYGSTPPPGIPKDQTLIFEIEFLKAL